MPSFFEKVLADAKGLEEEVLGPDYKYTDYIKSPDDLGMSDKGSISTLTKDVEGLIAYVEILASGSSKASKTGQPLGDKFFLETGAKCKDVATGKQVTRSLYVNNIPDGSMPFITSGMGVTFNDFRGLVPGVIENISDLNPMLIFQAFMSGSDPDCQAITMSTMDVNNNPGTKTAYVTNSDIQNMDACWFGPKGAINPVRYAKDPNDKGAICESFQNYNDNDNIKKDCSKMPNDLYVKLYYSLIAILGLYFLLKIFKKKF
jgi:hypothetical protein